MKKLKFLVMLFVVPLSFSATAKTELYCLESSWQDVLAWQIVANKDSYTLKGSVPTLDFKKVSVKLTYTMAKKFPLGMYVGLTKKSKKKITISLIEESISESFPETKDFKGSFKVDDEEFELYCYMSAK